jgi:hypothetical protein
MTMALSYMQADRIIRYGYMDAGIVGKQSDPSSEQLAEGMMRLNDIINFEQTQGQKLWLVSDTPVTLVAGQNTYTFNPAGNVNMVKPIKIMQGYWLSAQNIKTPLNVLSWEEWLRLSTTVTQGAINSYFVDKQQLAMKVSFWLTPDVTAATGTAHVLLRNQVTQFSGLTDNANFPLEWAMFLRWALADDLSTGQPQEIVARCEARAQAYRVALEDWDTEDANVTFVPDARMGQSTNTFSGGY